MPHCSAKEPADVVCLLSVIDITKWIDIICIANNLVNRDEYIFIGVEAKFAPKY